MSYRTNKTTELRLKALGRAGTNQKSASAMPRKQARNVDGESTRPRVQPPTYGFVDQQTGDKDQVEDTSTDDKINEAVDKKESDDTQVKEPVKPTRAAPRTANARAPTAPTATTSSTPTSAYFALWSSAQAIGITAVVKPKYSSFVPSSHLMYWYLFTMDRILWNNTALSKINSHYLSFSNYIYYGILFHVQILRSLTEAKVGIGKSAGSWLRAFIRSNPLESLPVAGPLVPLFNALAAVKTDDPMYTWIVPYFNFDKYIPSAYSSATISHLLPNVGPMLNAFWIMLHSDLDEEVKTGTIGTGQNVTDVTEPAFFDKNGNFIPIHPNPHSGHTFFGLTFVKNDAANKGLLRTPGLTQPPVEDKAQIKERRRFWQGSETYEHLGSHTPTHTTDQSFDKAIVMDQHLAWFQDFAEQAADQARFFHGSTSMANISLTSGNETLVKMKLKQNNADKSIHRNEAFYGSGTWGDVGQMSSTLGDTTREEFMTAGITQVNVEYPTAGTTHNWGPLAGAGGNAGATKFRTGPFFENELIQYETETDANPTATIRAVIKQQLFDPKGNAST